LTSPRAPRRVGSVAETERRRHEDVVLGAAAIGFGVAWRVGRIVSVPGRMVARSFLVQPMLRGAADGLAAAGRDARAEGRRRLEATAAVIVAAPETSRTIEHVLVQPPPEALNGESVERLAQRVLESPTFERVLRDAGESRVARELLDDAVHSAAVQQAVEEILVGPAVRRALARETATFWAELTARLRERARRLDNRAETFVRRTFRGAPRAVSPDASYSGLTSRGAAFAVDVAITQLTALVVGSLVGFLGSLAGLSLDGWLVATLSGAGWTLFVAGYFVFFWTSVGQTPGMRVLGVRVVDPHGGPPGAGRSLVRLVGTALAIAPLFAGFLPVLFDARRRALQDYLAATLVVNDDERRAEAPREPAPVSAPGPPLPQ
jgi:uncharacterized RDD family membrane protein YckC